VVDHDGRRRDNSTGASKPIVDVHTVLPVALRDQRCVAAASPDAVYLLCGVSLDEVLRVPVTSAAMAISPDAHWLFNEQREGMLGSWPVGAGLDVHRIRLGAPIRSMAIADQRGWLAAGTDSGEVTILDLDSWKERKLLRLAAAPVDQVTASSDGRSARRHRGRPRELGEDGEQVSAEGAWNARSSGSMATLSDAATNREIGRFDHGGEITAVRFVPALSPRWLVTAGDDGTLAVWPMRTDDLVHEACTRLHAIFDPKTLGTLIGDAHAEGSCEETHYLLASSDRLAQQDTPLIYIPGYHHALSIPADFLRLKDRGG